MEEEGRLQAAAGQACRRIDQYETMHQTVTMALLFFESHLQVGSGKQNVRGMQSSFKTSSQALVTLATYLLIHKMLALRVQIMHFTGC